MNETKRLTETDIVRCIQNAKLLGIRRKLKGSNRQVLANLIAMKVEKIRFRKLRIAVQRMEKVKATFKYSFINVGLRNFTGRCLTAGGSI